MYESSVPLKRIFINTEKNRVAIDQVDVIQIGKEEEIIKTVLILLKDRKEPLFLRGNDAQQFMEIWDNLGNDNPKS